MGKVRVTKEQVSELKQKIAFLENCCNRWGVLAEDAERPSIKMLVEALEGAIFQTHLDLEDFEKRDQADYFRGKIAGYREFLADIQRPAVKLERAKEQISQYKNLIRQAKEGLLTA